MKLRPNPLRLPIALCMLTLISICALVAREYPLFQPKSPQHVLFDYASVSDQSSKGSSTAKIQMVDDAQEKYPFVRLDFDVSSKASAFAGITFKLNDLRTVESDVQSALLMRLRISDPAPSIVLKVRDDQGHEQSVELSRFPGKGPTPWKYFEVPLSAFPGGAQKLRPLLDSVTLLVRSPGKGTIDVSMIGINAP